MLRRRQEVHLDCERRPELSNAVWQRVFHAGQCDDAKKRYRLFRPVPWLTIGQSTASLLPLMAHSGGNGASTSKYRDSRYHSVPLTEPSSPPHLFLSQRIILGATERPHQRTETRMTILYHWRIRPVHHVSFAPVRSFQGWRSVTLDEQRLTRLSYQMPPLRLPF